MQINGNDLGDQDGAGFENGWLAGTIRRCHPARNAFDVLLEVSILKSWFWSCSADNITRIASSSKYYHLVLAVIVLWKSVQSHPSLQKP